ncbi:HpcH 2,4-dihydroxyhept-2-ene-1,7-dioic acid aldolase [Candidatus Nanopelagicaceae bacterium]
MLFGILVQRSGKFGMETSTSILENRRLGIWNVLSDQSFIPLAFSDLDFAIIDLEHGYRDFSSCQSIVQGLIANQVEVFVRIRNSRDLLIQSFLDLGVDRFVVPQVRALEEIEELISKVNFPPNGVRGFHPRYSKLRKGGIHENRVQLFPIIETREILGFQQELLKLENVAGFYFGNFDLSMELNCSSDLTDPVILEVLEKTILNVSNSGKRFIVMPKDQNEISLLSSKRINDFVIGIDSEILFNSIQSIKDSYKGS